MNENKFIFEGNDEVKSERFREKHKFAFFKILTEYWKKYQEANKNIDAFIPDNIRERGQKYLKGSSELYSWFDEMYELTSEEDKEFVKLADVYNTFKQSDTYLNYSKAEKRELNKEKFIEEISHNLFLKSSYIERYTFYSKEGKRVEARNVLMNYKVKPAEESQENSSRGRRVVMVYNIESCGKCGKSCPEKTKIPQLKKQKQDFMKIGADFATPATTLDSIPRPLWHLWQTLPRLL